MSNQQEFYFDKFMKDIENQSQRRDYRYFPTAEEQGLNEQELKRLRMIRERELWQNRIQWRR
jgi:hypothetical protein